MVVVEHVILLEHRNSVEGCCGVRPVNRMQLPLTAAERKVFRVLRRTRCGHAVLLHLPRDGALQPGDHLFDREFTFQIDVMAAFEPLLSVRADTPLQLMQAAYHLGNRHVALELHEREFFLPEDAVLASMLRSRGLTVTSCEKPFLPECGAYEAGHAHGHGSPSA